MKNNGLPYLLIRNCVHFSGHANRAPVVHQFTEHKVDKEVWDPCILQRSKIKNAFPFTVLISNSVALYIHALRFYQQFASKRNPLWLFHCLPV